METDFSETEITFTFKLFSWQFHIAFIVWHMKCSVILLLFSIFSNIAGVSVATNKDTGNKQRKDNV